MLSKEANQEMTHPTGIQYMHKKGSHVWRDG